MLSKFPFWDRGRLVLPNSPLCRGEKNEKYSAPYYERQLQRHSTPAVYPGFYGGMKISKAIVNNDGLVKPIVNWAKHTEYVRRDVCSASEVGGKRYTRFPGQCEVITPGRSTDPHHHCPFLLPQTPRSPSSPQLAFFISHVLDFSRSSFPPALSALTLLAPSL